MVASACSAGGDLDSSRHNVKIPPNEIVCGVASRSSAPWPAGMKVLVVDDDPVCLKVVSQMLQKCNYRATVASNGSSALAELRHNPESYDLVLLDVYMPDVSGFKLLEHINFDLNLPVIVMSSDSSTDVVLHGVTHGAVDFLIKPVRLEELGNAWQHVVRRKQEQAANPGDFSVWEEDEAQLGSSDIKRKNNDKGKGTDDSDGKAHRPKRARVMWSVEMHQQFLTAVNQLGVDKAVPKSILEAMNVIGLTRENVASHLQKHRLCLRKMHQPTRGRGKGSLSSLAPNSPLDPIMQFYLQATSGTVNAQLAQRQLPLGVLLSGGASKPFPPDMSMQQVMSMGEAQQPGLLPDNCDHLETMYFTSGIPGVTDTSGLHYRAVPPLPQMAAGQGTVPPGTAEGAEVNDIAWLLAEQDSPSNERGRLSSGSLATATVTHCGGSAAEVTAVSYGSALHESFNKSGLQEGSPSSSVQSNSVSRSNGDEALHNRRPMATADAALYPQSPGSASGVVSTDGTRGHGAGVEAIPNVEASLGITFEDDAAFEQLLVNPEIFADPLLQYSLQQQHATEESPHNTAIQQSDTLGSDAAQQPLYRCSVLSDSTAGAQHEQSSEDKMPQCLSM